MASTVTALTSGGGIALSGDTSGSLQLQTNNGTTAMTIDTSQNVGIGTTSPTEKLTVAGAISATSNASNFDQAKATFDYASGAGRIAAYASTGGSLQFFTNPNAGNSTERMRIDSSGNLLVGNTGSAVNRLYVQDTRTDTNRTAIIYNAGNTSGNQCLGVTLGSNTNNTSSYFVVANGAGADRLYIYGNGNIVNSNNSYGALSDQAIKENIVDASPKLDDLMKVKVRSYNLIADEEKTKQLGVVAQELEEVFPSMIEVDGISGHKQVKYSVFVPILIKAIQEQQAIITDLKARIETLEGAKA